VFAALARKHDSFDTVRFGWHERLISMDYKGMQYDLVQMSNPAGWTWIVHLTVDKVRTGFSTSKGNAAFHAVRAINEIVSADAETGSELDQSALVRDPLPPASVRSANK